MKYYFALLTAITILVSCKKEVVTSHPGSEYFPNSSGNYWKYKLVDSISNSSSIVEVKIVGEKLLPTGQNSKIWTYNYPNHVDTNYVFQIGDTVKFLDNNFIILNTYIIPLQLNNKWALSRPHYYSGDTIQVNENRTFILNNQTFENSFLLYEHGYLPNAFLDKPEWFCPNVGMITKTEKDYDRIGISYTKYLYWELIQYDLK